MKIKDGQYYEVEMCCGNCGYYWRQSYPLGERVPASEVCPQCCCLEGRKVWKQQPLLGV